MMRRTKRVGWWAAWAAGTAMIAVTACGDDDEAAPPVLPVGPAVGVGGTGGTGGGSSTTTTGGGTSGCEVGVTEACYEGAVETEGVGLCVGGTRTCLADGTFGPCDGQVVPTTEDCSATGDEDCDGVACSETAWAALMTGIGEEYPEAVYVDADGNRYVGGSYDGGATFDGETFGPTLGSDAFLMKLDPAGNLLWARRYGAAGYDVVQAITMRGNGNIVVVGRTGSSINFGTDNSTTIALANAAFVAELTPDGNHVWSRAVATLDGVDPPSGTSSANGVAVDGMDRLYVVGEYDGFLGGTCFGTCTTSQGVDGFIRAFDGQGTFAWQRNLTGAAVQRFEPVVPHPSGTGIVVGGRLYDAASLVGTPIDHANAQFGVVAQISATGGVDEAVALGGFVYVLDAVGDRITIAGTAAESFDFFGNALTATATTTGFVGQVTLAGATFSHAWSHAFGDAGARFTLFTGAMAPDGSVAVGGYLTGTGDIGGVTLTAPAVGDSGWLAVFDSDGATRWGRTFPTAVAQDEAGFEAVAIEPDGHVFGVGYTTGDLDVGSEVLTAADAPHGFLVSVQP